MRKLTLGGVGMAVAVGALIAGAGCSGSDPAAGSMVGQAKAGSGGTGGGAGSLNLGGGAGGGGSGGGGAGGAAGATGVAGASAGTTHGGGSVTGGSSTGGSATGGSGTGGSKPAGMCKRATAGDAECADFDETAPQAYDCDGPSSYSTLNSMHGSKCLSVNFVPGAELGACCPP